VGAVTKKENKVELTNYVRKPFAVSATRVSSENFDEVAELTGGHIQHGLKNGRAVKFIEVPVKKVLDVKQKHAFVGDWVLQYQGGWKVYTHRAFRDSFEQDHTSTKTAGEALDSLNNIFQSSGQVTDEELQELRTVVSTNDAVAGKRRR
jgi:hypothetical protein